MSERIAAIHQPNYLPWIGYFHKIYQSDIFIFLDDVEYTSGSWIDRNRIKTPNGWTWLTVPTTESNVPIRDVRVANQEGWRDEHYKTFTHNYGGADYFEELDSLLEETYDREWEFLYPLNRHLIEGICDRVGIDYEFVEASTFDVTGEGSERLAELCTAIDADTYLCGMGADDYMEDSVFEDQGVSVQYQDIEHPTYDQQFEEFIPRLSFFDMVMNVGHETAYDTLQSL